MTPWPDIIICGDITRVSHAHVTLFSGNNTVVKDVVNAVVMYSANSNNSL